MSGTCCGLGVGGGSLFVIETQYEGRSVARGPRFPRNRSEARGFPVIGLTRSRCASKVSSRTVEFIDGIDGGRRIASP